MPEQTEIVSGIVKWFDKNKGFGFIVPDDGGDDVLLHAKDLPLGFDKMQIMPGDRMSAVLRSTKTGWAVHQVTHYESRDTVSRLVEALEAAAASASPEDAPGLRQGAQIIRALSRARAEA